MLCIVSLSSISIIQNGGLLRPTVDCHDHLFDLSRSSMGKKDKPSPGFRRCSSVSWSQQVKASSSILRQRGTEACSFGHSKFSLPMRSRKMAWVLESAKKLVCLSPSSESFWGALNARLAYSSLPVFAHPRVQLCLMIVEM